MSSATLLNFVGSRSNNLPDQVYDVLREQIVLGEFVPGDRLTEMSIASRLGVSRTPVHEALLALARDGLLVKVGRSFALHELNRDDIREVYELRRLLEPDAVLRAVTIARDADISELSRILEDQRAAHAKGGFEAFASANARFRSALFSLTDNRRLRSAIELYNDHLRFLRVRLNQARWREVVLKNHTDLLIAMRVRDGAAATQVWMTAIDDSDEAAREWFNEVNKHSPSGNTRRRRAGQGQTRLKKE
jgi:DNA-binding GntR family transcriptional regulator